MWVGQIAAEHQDRNHDDSGASAVEYALLVALIGALLFGIVMLFAIGVEGLFDIAREAFGEG